MLMNAPEDGTIVVIILNVLTQLGVIRADVTLVTPEMASIAMVCPYYVSYKFRLHIMHNEETGVS